MQNRRDFLKQTCSLCAAAAGLGFLASQLESCKSTEGVKATSTDARVIVTKNQITLPLDVFGDQKNYLVKDFSLDYNILVVKHPDDTYVALQMKCTHKGYPLKVTPDNLFCSNHGSTFDFDGNVTKSPATRPLTKYPCSVENNTIVVHLNS